MINPYIILAVVVAFVANGFYWHHSGDKSGYGRAVTEYNVKLLAATNAARAKEQYMQTRLQEAQNAATQRDQTLRAAAASAATAGDRLRIALDTIRAGLPNATPTASRDTAATLATVFGDCAKEYRGLAEIADRHASDSRTLTEAWPRGE